MFDPTAPIEVLMPGTISGIDIDLSVGNAAHLQFDRGTHTVHIAPIDNTERILINVKQDGLRDILQNHTIARMKISFELVPHEKGESNGECA